MSSTVALCVELQRPLLALGTFTPASCLMKPEAVPMLQTLCSYVAVFLDLLGSPIRRPMEIFGLNGGGEDIMVPNHSVHDSFHQH